jgi:hypothetical protein
MTARDVIRAKCLAVVNFAGLSYHVSWFDAASVGFHEVLSPLERHSE